jgi:hypothetical protein
LKKVGTDQHCANWGKLKTFHLKSETRQECLSSPLSFNIVLNYFKNLSQCNKAREINKRDANGKGRSKFIPICK